MPAPISSPIAGSFAKLGLLDLEEGPDLRRYLAWVPDPQGRCGRWYSLSSLLAVCAAAVCAGAVTVEAVVEWAADAPAKVLAALGVRRLPLGRRQLPSRRCLTGVLAQIDADGACSIGVNTNRAGSSKQQLPSLVQQFREAPGRRQV